MNEQIPVNLQDLYLIIGEKETLRFLMQREIDRQNQQIMEMSKEIGELRQQLDGKLGQPKDLDPIRRVPSGVQGAGFGFVPNVPGQPNEPSGGDYPTPAFPSEAPRVGRSNMDRSTAGD